MPYRHPRQWSARAQAESPKLDKLRREVIADKLKAAGIAPTGAAIDEVLRDLENRRPAPPAPGDQAIIVGGAFRKQVQAPALPPAWDTSSASRRRHLRWYLPIDTLEAQITAPAAQYVLPVIDVSRGGIGCKASPNGTLRPGEQVDIRIPGTIVTFGAVVQRRAPTRVGFVAPDQDALRALEALAKARNAVCVQRRGAGAVAIEGFLGFHAAASLRFAHKIFMIDLAKVSGIDGHGIGVLLGHLERGCIIEGCPTGVRNTLRLAGFCGRRCTRCTEVRPTA